MGITRIAAVALGVGLVVAGCAAPGETVPDTGGSPSPLAQAPSPTPFVTTSPAPADPPPGEAQVVEWPAERDAAMTARGMGPLVVGALLPVPSPRGALSECGVVAGVPENVRVSLLDDGTVVTISASAPLGGDEIEVATDRGIGLGARRNDVLDAYGRDAEYREVALQGAFGELTEYRVDVDLGGAVLIFTFDIRDAGEAAPAPDSLVVEEIRLAMPEYVDAAVGCA